MNLYTTLKELCLIPGISGREKNIRAAIEKKIAPFVTEVRTDTLGNLIALKKGRTGEKKIMLCAHMDEIGYLANFIEENGLIRVGAIGGVGFANSAYSKVVSENGVVGFLAPDASVAPADIVADKMYIDIGASTKKEAERKVRIGDSFVGEPSLCKLYGKRVAGRPIDDRVGCLVLLAVAESLKDTELDADIYFVFSVQEEVGCRGSKPATFAISPDIAICFDVTATGDTPSAKPMACALGGGAAIKIKDNSVICHEDIVKALCKVAEAEKIPYQREVLTFGGTDTSSMQLTGCGAMAGAISIPMRYVHSGVETCDMKDVAACVSLAEKYLLSL